MKKVLITGGGGFVGRNLFEQLKKKYTMYAPLRSQLDLCDYHAVEDYIKEKKIEVIVHTAIQGGDCVLDQTLRMFASVLRNIDRVEKIIHFGSGAEYAKTCDLIKIKESEWGQYIPVDDYGFAKYMLHYIIRNEKKIVNLRLFGVYGKYEDYRYTFISNSIVKSLFGLPIRIKQNVIFDYLYINDLVSVVDFFIRNSHKYAAYNVTPDTSIDLKSIVTLINDIIPFPAAFSVAYCGYNKQYTGSNALLKSFIPDISFTSYRQGIGQLVQYYRSIIDTIERDDIMRDAYYKRIKLNIPKKR